jgi:hypothetical protein
MKYIMNKELVTSRTELHKGDELEKKFCKEHQSYAYFKDDVYVCNIDSLFEKLHINKNKEY